MLKWSPQEDGERSKVKVKVHVDAHGVIGVSSVTVVHRLKVEEQRAGATVDTPEKTNTQNDLYNLDAQVSRLAN